MSLLEVRHLSVAYGRIRAVRDVHFAIAQGEACCLIGANGAGKTTTLRALSGMHAVESGEILFAGEPVTQLAAQERVARGIALVPEGRGIFARLTVAENLDLGAWVRRDADGIRADRDRMYALFPRLAERRAQYAGTLSGGEQQMLAIARALMSRPKLLLLDEPSMGLAPILVAKIFETLGCIRDEGVTLLLVEQNARLALRTATQGHVMDGGRITLSRPAHELLDDPAVRKAYLGG